MNHTGMCVEVDRLDRGKLVDETECCCRSEERTLYDVMQGAIGLQRAAREHLSCAFDTLGLKPGVKKENAERCATTITGMAYMLEAELSELYAMACTLQEKVGMPKVNNK